MPTIIKYHHWAGGEGAGDRNITIGYCKESTVEVLKKIIQTHVIHSYKDIRPIDEYPANISGLCIDEYNPEYGIIINGSIDIILECVKSKRLIWDGFKKEKFKENIKRMNKYFCESFDDENPYGNTYKGIIEEFEQIYEFISGGM